jgi:hypothetical protein
VAALGWNRAYLTDVNVHEVALPNLQITQNKGEANRIADVYDFNKEKGTDTIRYLKKCYAINARR